MKKRRADSVLPIEGETFPASASKVRVIIFTCLGGVLVGLGLVFLRWQDWVGNSLLVCGVVLALFSGLGLFRSIQGAYSKERLIIGADRIQVVVHEGKVVSQFPYHNVADVSYVDHAPPFIGINLMSTEDEETFTNGLTYKESKEHNGYDVVIVDFYVASPKEILDKLLHHYEAYPKSENRQGS